MTTTHQTRALAATRDALVALFGLSLLTSCGAGTLGSSAMGIDSGAEADSESVVSDGSDASRPRDATSARDATPANEGGLPPGEVVLGGPGCGFSAAAFCDTFDGPATVRGRAGELDATHWSGARLAPQLPSGNGVFIGIGPAEIPATCRAGLPSSVLPDQDALICEPNSAINSAHLMVVAAAQNYGQNSYRIRQPFDFAARTGTIKFDAEGVVNALLGWVSVEITDEPVNAPSFAAGGVSNDEGSLIPRHAIEVQFQNGCAGVATEPSVGVRMVALYEDYQLSELVPSTPVCVRTEAGKLNRFEVRLSQNRIEVLATPFSSDGVSFGTPVALYAGDIALPFSRGYVHITTHNHATLKYSEGNSLQAWIARWDNVGFDGPVISNVREYEAPDSLAPGQDAWNRPGPVVSVGYRIPDTADTPLRLTLRGVDTRNVERARLSVSAWYLTVNADPSTFILRHRWNSGVWRDRPLSAGELALLNGDSSQGQLGHVIDVPVADLVDGDNILELSAVNVPQNYPPVAANIDLVLDTK